MGQESCFCRFTFNGCFSSFAVNKTQWTGLLASTRPFFFKFERFDFGPHFRGTDLLEFPQHGQITETNAPLCFLQKSLQYSRCSQHETYNVQGLLLPLTTSPRYIIIHFAIALSFVNSRLERNFQEKQALVFGLFKSGFKIRERR